MVFDLEMDIKYKFGIFVPFAAHVVKKREASSSAVDKSYVQTE